MDDADHADAERADDGADPAVRAAAETAVGQCLNVGPEESCVVVTDDETRAVGEALYRAARDRTDGAVVVRSPPGEQHGAEPSAPVAAAMRAADVFLAPTAKSLSHTRARDAANEAGARGVTMPGITRDVMVAGLDADYEAIAAECDRVRAAVAGAETLRVVTPAGTDLTVEPGGREWRSDTGLVHDPGAFSNLPAGEVFVSPETGDGRYVVDGTTMPHGLVDDPIEFVVEDGLVTSVSDDAVREQLETAAAEVGDAAYNLAELGVGTNVGVASLVGSVLLDEKAAGTVHVAVGDDASIGGDVEAPVHLDGVLRDPTLYADGEPIELPSGV
jgi:leucyl aminopeptidase (aminopeptidase T)